MKTLHSNVFRIINFQHRTLLKIPTKSFTIRNRDSKYNDTDFINKSFNMNLVEEPEEYRTIYIENLPLDWDEDEIKLRLEQTGNISKMHLIRNTIGDSLGKVIVTYSKIDDSITAMNSFRNKIPFFDPLKIRFYRRYDFTINKLLLGIKHDEKNEKRKNFLDFNRKEVLLIKNVPQELLKEDLKLFISEFKAPVHISYPRDIKGEFKRIAYVYFPNEEDAENVLKYLHLRWVQNKQLFVSYANNYIDISDWRTRVEQGIQIENKQLEMKYFLRQIGLNMKLIEGLQKLALQRPAIENKSKFLENDLIDKNKYLNYKYRLLDYQGKQINEIEESKHREAIIEERKKYNYKRLSNNNK